MKKSIGILGGTFNPIHYGHLRIAEEIAENLNLDEVRFVPSANPPHKPTPNISATHRAEMVKLAIENNPTFLCDSRELARTGASYTIDTLISLRQELGQEVSLCIIMGTDAFTQLHSWHRWKELIQYCHIVLVQRPASQTPQQPLPTVLEHFLRDHFTENIADIQESATGFICMQNVTALAISSTNIRERLKNKQSIRYLMPQNVIEYIEKNQLYCL